MPALRPDIDPDGLLAYSVVVTGRSLTRMRPAFRQVVRASERTLCDVDGAHRAVVTRGGGTYAMGSVARQFVSATKARGIRNAFFFARGAQMFEAGSMPSSETVL